MLQIAKHTPFCVSNVIVLLPTQMLPMFWNVFHRDIIYYKRFVLKIYHRMKKNKQTE